MASLVRFHGLRWVAFAVFVISSTLNYVDRLMLNVLAPLIMLQLHFNQTDFGFLIAAFSISYAASSLLAGWFLDRVGVNRGIFAAVTWWSTAAVATGLVRTFGGLAVSRAGLGIGESAGVPAVGKLNAIYLKPEERALGAAVNQIGLSLGAPVAALFIGIATTYSWRVPFIVCGLLGFLWMPLWMVVSRAIPPPTPGPESPPRANERSLSILLDRSLLLLVLANVLWMGAYSLWSNWTTLYLTGVHHLTLQQSARYVWIPPMISNLGGFFGGWLSLEFIRRSVEPVAARKRAIWVSALGLLITVTLPFASDASWATVVISLSFFFALAGSVNIYAIPIDLYGAARSGLAISALTCAFGILQTVISPVIGYLSDRRMYTGVIWLVTLPPFLAAIALEGLGARRSE